MDEFPLDAQGLAAGGEQVQAGRLTPKPFCQIGHGLDEVLAIVEHDERAALLEAGHERRQRIVGVRLDADGGGHQTGDQMAIGQPRQIDEIGPALEAALQRVRKRDGHRGFADAPGPHHGDEAVCQEILAQVGEGVLAADHATKQRGQNGRSGVGRRRGERRRLGGRGRAGRGGCRS